MIAVDITIVLIMRLGWLSDSMHVESRREVTNDPHMQDKLRVRLVCLFVLFFFFFSFGSSEREGSWDEMRYQSEKQWEEKPCEIQLNPNPARRFDGFGQVPFQLTGNLGNHGPRKFRGPAIEGGQADDQKGAPSD